MLSAILNLDNTTSADRVNHTDIVLGTARDLVVGIERIHPSHQMIGDVCVASKVDLLKMHPRRLFLRCTPWKQACYRLVSSYVRMQLTEFSAIKLYWFCNKTILVP